MLKYLRPPDVALDPLREIATLISKLQNEVAALRAENQALRDENAAVKKRHSESSLVWQPGWAGPNC